MGLWSTFRSKAFTVKSINTQLGKEFDEKGLKKVLNAFDLVMFGVGGILGAGVFVLTGEAARKYAGPSVVLSYAVASLAALFSALCYAEFAVDLPVAGSAYNYISLVFGEFLAWVAAINLIMEYCLSSSTVAKGFTSYFATMVGLNSEAFSFSFGGNIFNIDPLAFGLTIALSVLLAFGIKESSLFNIIVSGINLASILFVLIASIPFCDTKNWVPFVPPEFGINGMIRAASIVFFSYIGFDGVATVAEEVRNPTRDLPIGIVGSLGIVTALYMAMAVAITGMQSYRSIDIDAPYAVAFNDFGLHWAAEIVSIGAVTGIVTCLMVTLLGMARIFMVLGRERLLPQWMARVHPRYGTPLNATIVTGIVSGLPALILNIDLLAKMVSMGTLFVLCMVNVGVVWRRYFQPRKSKSPMPVVWRLILMVAASIMEGLAGELHLPVWVWGVPVGVWLATTLSFWTVPVVYKSGKFCLPLQPVIPALGILFTVHLMCSLGWEAYTRFFIWQILGVVVYLSYCMYNTLPVVDLSDIEEPLLEGEGPSASSEDAGDQNDAVEDDGSP